MSFLCAETSLTAPYLPDSASSEDAGAELLLTDDLGDGHPSCQAGKANDKGIASLAAQADSPGCTHFKVFKYLYDHGRG